jgi:hypothetical protein
VDLDPSSTAENDRVLRKTPLHASGNKLISSASSSGRRARAVALLHPDRSFNKRVNNHSPFAINPPIPCRQPTIIGWPSPHSVRQHATHAGPGIKNAAGNSPGARIASYGPSTVHTAARRHECQRPTGCLNPLLPYRVFLTSFPCKDLTNRPHRLSRPSISDADYDRLYAEIFGDIVCYIPPSAKYTSRLILLPQVRRLNLDKGRSSDSHEDALLDARPGNASLPTFHREVSSIVRDQVSPDNGLPASQSDINPIKEPALERSPDHVRKILRDSLPSQDVSRHLLDMFFDYQNSIFYVCNREEAQTQLALMYEDPTGVSISWFCQMFLIFAVGVQFDDIYDTDGATYHEIGQKYIDDAIDENPQSTIWVIRAMLLLCIYEPPAKWNSVWMHLGNAIDRRKLTTKAHNR